MLAELPPGFWGVIAVALGAVIGSFLNVVIWRMPRGESLSMPGSHCPKCDRSLSAIENIPVLSYLVQGGKCRGCKTQIHWRYPAVELLTAALFLSMYLHFGAVPATIAYCLFAAALVAAFFIDLAHYIIPDELNNFALACGIGLDLLGITRGDAGHALLWGWLPRSVGGAVACAGVFVAIQVLGMLAFRKEAMGDGDVKLARAIGALLPIGQALVSFGLAIGLGAVIGGAAMLFRRKPDGNSTDEPYPDAGEEEDDEGDEVGLAQITLWGLGYLCFVDVFSAMWQFVTHLGKPRERPTIEDDDFAPGPTHIPFGPFMVAGALLAVFIGDRLIGWYMSWSGLDRLAG